MRERKTQGCADMMSLRRSGLCGSLKRQLRQRGNPQSTAHAVGSSFQKEPQLVEKISQGLSRAAALDFPSRAATCTVRAKSLAPQGFLYTERWPRHRRKRDVSSS